MRILLAALLAITITAFAADAMVIAPDGHKYKFIFQWTNPTRYADPVNSPMSAAEQQQLQTEILWMRNGTWIYWTTAGAGKNFLGTNQLPAKAAKEFCLRSVLYEKRSDLSNSFVIAN